MILNKQTQKLWKYLSNIQGWRTNRKIIVIESDDWGSIRMPSKKVYEKCLKVGYPVDKIAYERYDSLASQDDLELLFELLKSVKDIHGNHPIITANCVVANPDFQKIEDDKFQSYYYEIITSTFKRYPHHSNNLLIWKQGIAEYIFYPQLHGREHLNVSLFMEDLQKGQKDALFGFRNGMPGCLSLGSQVKGNKYVEATRYRSLKEKQEILDYYLEGLELFEKIFDYRSESIIPTSYTWSPDFDKPVFDKGINFFQGIRKMREPNFDGSYKYHSIYMGKRNTNNQVYLVRNSLFEPSMFKLKILDPVDRCLSDISSAFNMRKPCIIGSHRLNYVGFIDIGNRDRTLKMLDQILKTALRKWPDIEFMSSIQLGREIISEDK